MARLQKVKYLYGWYTSDGHLKDNEGRIVIFEDKIMVSYTSTMDHNYLLRALASRYKFNKDQVINKAIRLYYAHEGDTIIISPTRQTDDDLIKKDYKFYGKLIKSELK